MRKALILICIVIHIKSTAQQVLPVTDSLPAILDGLRAGYSITEQSEKEVGSKGNFSRYKLRFFVTNTGTEAKIFLQKSGFLNSGSAAHDIVTFKCANATGARLTNKTATLQMNPCVMEATVEDKECGTDKINKNRRMVDIGYWIKPGETVATNTIMIVPLNEKPSMSVTFYPFNNGVVGSLSNHLIDQNNGNYEQHFVHLKNVGSNYYLNNQNGPVACSSIDYGWWSSQWEILPVAGSNNFIIKQMEKQFPQQ